MKFLIVILFAVCCFFSVSHWLNNFQISPDSSNYITAAENLAKDNSLFVYANWPSKSFEPKTEPYTDYIPGLPMIASVFFLFTDNPDSVMLVSYSLFIILLYAIAFFVMNELKINYFFSGVFVLFITFAEPLKFIFSYFWTETLFSAFTLLAIFFAVKLLKHDEKKYWILGCIAVALSAFIKMYGILNISFFVVPFFVHRKKVLNVILFVIGSAMPVLIWYLRNKILYGYFTYSHNLFGVFNSYNVTRPFKYILFLLGNDKAANALALILLFICLGTVFIKYKSLIRDNRSFLVWKTLAIGLLVNFFGLYFLSIVSSFDYLESRLLAPLFILFFLLLISSLQIIFEVFQNKMQITAYSIFALPLIFFVVSPLFQKEMDYSIKIKYPKEHKLWNEIRGKEFVKNSSHFITDLDYIHQIYSDMPQRIILHDYLFLNLDFIRKITAIGKTPFIILRNNELPYFYFSRYHKILNYQKSEISSRDFTVYVKSN